MVRAAIAKNTYEDTTARENNNNNDEAASDPITDPKEEDEEEAREEDQEAFRVDRYFSKQPQLCYNTFPRYGPSHAHRWRISSD